MDDILKKLEAVKFYTTMQLERLKIEYKDLPATEMQQTIHAFENNILTKIIEKHGMESEKSKFYAKVLKCMYSGFIAELDIQHLREAVTYARMECEFHKQMATFNFNELQRYKVVKEVTETHDLQAMINALKEDERLRTEALKKKIN
jgi:hypothetical protein